MNGIGKSINEDIFKNTTYLMSKQFKFYSGAVCDKEKYREKQRRRMEMNICCI